MALVCISFTGLWSVSLVSHWSLTQYDSHHGVVVKEGTGHQAADGVIEQGRTLDVYTALKHKGDNVSELAISFIVTVNLIKLICSRFESGDYKRFDH